jgi:hypothetical protein
MKTSSFVFTISFLMLIIWVFSTLRTFPISISGTVNSSTSGDAIEGVKIDLYAQSNMWLHTTFSDKRGTFGFFEHGNGELRLVIGKVGFMNKEVSFPYTPDEIKLALALDEVR